MHDLPLLCVKGEKVEGQSFRAMSIFYLSRINGTVKISSCFVEILTYCICIAWNLAWTERIRDKSIHKKFIQT
jgi:hypothetical protein